MTPGAGDALIVIDMQRDFLPGGSLAVPAGDRILAAVNRCLDLFSWAHLPVYASRDWHPPGHCSFQPQGGPWPPHCVAGSPGAAFAEGLHLPPGVTVVSKATQDTVDAYSAFGGTDLASRLAAATVKRLFVVGLATDYCVLHTVLDALEGGFEVVVLGDAIAAVDVAPGDGERAIARMRQAGASVADSAALWPGARSGPQPAGPV